MHLEWSEYINNRSENNYNNNTTNELIKGRDYIINIENISKDIEDYIKNIKNIKNELDISEISNQDNIDDSNLLNNIQDFDYRFYEKINTINKEILNYENNDSMCIKDNSINKMINLLFTNKSANIENYDKFYLPDIKYNNYLKNELDDNLSDNLSDDSSESNSIEIKIKTETETETEAEIDTNINNKIDNDEINIFIELYKLIKNLISNLKAINNEILILEKKLDHKIKNYKEICKCKELFELLIIDDNNEDNTDDNLKPLFNKLFEKKIRNLNINETIERLKSLILNKKKYYLIYNILQLSKTNNLICSICFCEGEYICFNPCGHTCCSKCVTKLLNNKCHVCRTTVVTFQKIYFN
jgi:hypothetical protein